MVEAASEAHISLYLSPVERAKLESYYESEFKRLGDEVKAKKQLWEEARQKNVDLSKQLTEQKIKVVNLQRMMARAGRNDNTSTDSEINTQFLVLRSNILQMVKNHLSYHTKKPHSTSSPEQGELWLRRTVAGALYKKFFSREAMPFGFNDQLLEKSPMRLFEETLRRSRCDGMSPLQAPATFHMGTNYNNRFSNQRVACCDRKGLQAS